MEEIDYNEFTLEELQLKLEDFQKRSSDFYNEEQGIKLTLNSIYGALGNKWFALNNKDVGTVVDALGPYRSIC